MPRAKKSTTADRLIAISRALTRDCAALEFSEPVAFIYHPLEYARATWEQYLARYGGRRGVALMLGMNTIGFPRTVAGWSWAQIQFERDRRERDGG